MLSYRHGFHAGNFADVCKHLILVQLIQALQSKPSAFCYIDTHSGSGRYNLTAEFAQKTAEFKTGIELLWRLAETSIPPAAADYLQILREFNAEQLRIYLGSAALVRHCLRPQDAMILMELHPSDYAALKMEFYQDSQAHLHQRDGFEGLIALTPPLQKRGLVLIDPSYELKSDYITVVETVKTVYKRWQNAIYVVWYPIFAEAHYHEKMLRKFAGSGIKKILQVELNRYPSHTPRALIGSGLIIINPPYLFESLLQTVMPWLWSVLSPQAVGNWSVKWLVSEA